MKIWEQEVLFVDVETSFVKNKPLVFCEAAVIQYMPHKSWDEFKKEPVTWARALDLYKEVKVLHITQTPLEELEAFKANLRAFLLDKTKKLVGFNLQFDLMVLLKFLYNEEVFVGQPITTKTSQFVALEPLDLSLILRHVHSGYTKNSLSDWCGRIFNFKLDKTLQTIDWASCQILDNNQLKYIKLDVIVLVLLLSHIIQAKYTWQNSFKQIDRCSESNPFDLSLKNPIAFYRTMEQPLLMETIDMALRGLHLDLNQFNNIKNQIIEIETLQTEAHNLGWQTNNIISEIKSGQSLEAVENPDKLWGLAKPFPRTGQRNLVFSLSKISIWFGQNFTKNSPNVALLLKLLQFRNKRKEIGTLQKNIWVKQQNQWSPIDRAQESGEGFVFFQTNLMGAKTGRITTSKMNIIGLSHSSGLRRVIRPSEKNNVFFICDIKQAEVRIFSQLITTYYGCDNVFYDVFKNKKDWHKMTASYILNKDEAEVTQEERTLAKKINFGLLYLMGPETLRDHLAKDGIFKPLSEVKELHAKWHKKHPQIKLFSNVLKDLFLQSQNIKANKAVFQNQPQQKQDKFFITTFAGRKKMTDYKIYNLEKYIALPEICNFPVQGGCTDILMECWQQTLEWAPEEGRLVLSVFDEFVFEVEKTKTEKLAKKFEKIIHEVGKKYLPDIGLEIDTIVADYWQKP